MEKLPPPRGGRSIPPSAGKVRQAGALGVGPGNVALFTTCPQVGWVQACAAVAQCDYVVNLGGNGCAVLAADGAGVFVALQYECAYLAPA